MEYEFDKEIDSLLRQTRPETFASEPIGVHIDADEISLFAENALTQKVRMRVTEHLADCAKCRKILSNVVALNAEANSEIVHTKEPEIVVAENKIPWYRRLFAFPQLAYTMGGLTVLLAGMIGYVMLQSSNESKNASIAQMERSVERPQSAVGADSEGETMTVETYPANAASSAVNTTVTTANTTANIAAKSNVAVSNAANAAAVPTKKDQPAAAAPPPVAVNNLTEKAPISENKVVETANNYSADAVTSAGAQQNYSQNSVSRNQTVMPDSRSVQAPRQVENLPTQGRQMQRESLRVMRAPMPENDAPKEKSEPEKTKSVGGKNFVYRDNVWYDQSYRQQPTTNVSRNSEEYKKLDSGLRSIAANLGGTVVVVWNGKAYRIQ